MGQPPSDTENLVVFVSYSREDLAFADQLVVTLELAGFAPTIDRVGIHGAEKWREKLGTLIRESDTVVFVLSPASASSEVCAWEVEQAVAMGKRIIPVAARPLDGIPPPPELATLNYIFFYLEPSRPGSGWAAGLRELDKTLRMDHGWLREHTRLLTRATEWASGGRAASRLLSGDDIIEAKGWAARQPREAPAPTALHVEFIAASEAWADEQRSERRRQLEERERLVAEAEANRAEREKAQAEALAAADRERRQALKTARHTFVGLVAVGVLAMLATGASWWALEKQREAIAERETAKEQTRQAIALQRLAERMQARAEEQTRLAVAESKRASDASEVIGVLNLKAPQLASTEASADEHDRKQYGDFVKAAAKGNVVAMTMAGIWAFQGRGTERNYDEARKHWELAAASGHSDAMYNLGFLYETGEGPLQDFVKAREWYEKASSRGDTLAMLRIAAFFAEGIGHAPDPAKAMDWYEKAANAGDKLAMRIVGQLYSKGVGIAPDLAKARTWYESAAAAGDAVAMIDLGVLYMAGGHASRNLVKARHWFEKAAALGEANAVRLLSRLAPYEAADAGRFGEALRLLEARATEKEADEVRAHGKASANTAHALGSVAWYALLAHEPARALAAAERALALDSSQVWIEGNRAHALMYLGRSDEARALFLLHKGKLVSADDDKPWRQVIGEDFAVLRKAGLAHPMMAEIEAALGADK